nr:PREDICTED: probable peptide/nitrate transporter At3g43790 isoform X1 [Musa acuminata subsp. malaccensis]
MEANTGPLLKVYYENCPGCKQDRKNEVRRGVPYREFFYIWIVTLCSALPVASLFPFLYFMTQDLHVAKREEDIGFYAGFVGSAFMIGRVLTSVFWGIVADRYGRKPVIVISIISVILFNTMFGLSTSYWMALVSRLLLGCFNGLLGPIRAYASEVCRKEYQALGLSLVSSTRGIGLIVGPAIGGFFAQPAKKYPNIFSIKSLFGRFPYFLPCFCISLIATGALVACFWLPETLHMHDKWEIEDLEDSLIRCETKKYNDEIEGTMLASKQSLIKNRPLMSAIIVYCAFALQDTAYAEIFSLWAVSNKTYGGLSFSSQEVGEVLAISGLSLLVYQLFLYPCFEKYLGPISSLRAAAIFSIPLLTSYPFMSKLSGLKLFFVVNCASLLKSAISVTITTGFNILQNNAVSQHQRGAQMVFLSLHCLFPKLLLQQPQGLYFHGHKSVNRLPSYQVPVPPLHGAADAPPVFNQLWMNEPDQLSDGPLEKGIPTLITWNRGGNVVLVEGSWDDWTSRKHLQRSGKDHAILMVLPSGVYRYKFIVDGQLKYIPDLPFVSDEMGNITNLLDVHDYVPENVESISEFDLPPSPDSSYSWSLTDEDFAKEPPLVPSQLHLTVLGMQNTDEEASPKPQHVVLNHLFIEKGSSSQSMVALGLSHRFQSKYVTVVLYKPVRR